LSYFMAYPVMSSRVKTCTSKFLCLGHPVITVGKGRGSSVQVEAVVDEWRSSTQDMDISYVGIVMTWLIQVSEKARKPG
jgi:hypothetical protein